MVVGLGYVGLTLALVLADRGRRVVGVEADRDRRDLLRANVSFAFANMAAKIAARFGLDGAETIALANGGYPRNLIPMPSRGVGGPCLRKDSVALTAIAEAVGVDATLLDGARRINDSMPEFVVAQVRSEAASAGLTLPDMKVLVCGMAFKGDQANIVVVVNNHPAYATLEPSTILRLVKPGVLWLDLWSLHRAGQLGSKPRVRYRTLGARPSLPLNIERAAKRVSERARQGHG